MESSGLVRLVITTVVVLVLIKKFLKPTGFKSKSSLNFFVFSKKQDDYEDYEDYDDYN